MQGGFCRQKHSHKNIDPGGKAGRAPKNNDQKPRKPTETQGPCPNLRGTCTTTLAIGIQLSGIARPPFRARPLVTGTGENPRDPPRGPPPRPGRAMRRNVR